MSFRALAHRLSGLLLIAAALFVPGCTCNPSGKGAPKTDMPGGAATSPQAAPATPAPQAASAPPSKCDELASRVRKFFDGLPAELSALSSEERDNLAMETEKHTIACGQYLAECDSHALAGEVYHITAKLLHLMSARRLMEWQTQARGQPNAAETVSGKKSAYMQEIARLAGTAFEKLAADHRLRPRALELQGQALSEADEHEKAHFVFEKFLEVFPADEERCTIITAVVRALLEMEKFDEGIGAARKALDDCYTSKNYPYINEFLWKLHHSKGDFEGMLEQTKRVETVYPHKLSGGTIADRDREVYERFLSFNGFRRGYTLFAMGRFEEARKAFQAHIDEIESKQKALRTGGKELKPEVAIYVDRSRTCLKAVEELAGLPAPAELDLGGTWVTPKQVQLREARGKVIGLTFRGQGDERSASFIGPLSQWVAKQPNMELVTVYYRKGSVPLAQAQAELMDENARLEYAGAAGFDPDEVYKSLFKRYQANVGSATFIVINGRGELVWYQQDPRGIDVHFARAVMTGSLER